MAPGDEYTAGGGGKLKLKGSKVSDGRVDKKKKKSKKSKSDKEGEVGSAPPEARHPDEDGRSEEPHPDDRTPDDAGATVGKTEAERKYEEARKKRVRISFCLQTLPTLWRWKGLRTMDKAADIGVALGTSKAGRSQDSQGASGGVE
jgi:protein FAM32A